MKKFKLLPSLLKQYRNQIIFPLIAAVLMAAAFPPYSAYGLSFIALVPLLYSILIAKNFKDVLVTSFSMTVFIVFTGFYWVGDVAVNFGGLPWIVGKIVLVVFSCFGEMQFLFFGLAVFYFLKNFKIKNKFLQTLILSLVIPIFYVGIDAVNPKIFPNSLGHGLLGWLSLSQIAEITGVTFLTFLIVWSNTVFALLILKKNEQNSTKALMSSLVVGCGIVLFISNWGNKRIHSLEIEQNNISKKIKIALIQANIGDLEKLASERGSWNAIYSVIGKYKEQSIQAKKEFSPDLIVWPETAYPLLYTHGENLNANRAGSANDQWMLDFIRELNIPLAFGGYSQKEARDYNSIFLLNPPNELKGIYRKNILLAFGEYVPLGPLAPLVQKLIPSIADFGRGEGPMLFHNEILTKTEKFQYHFTPQICYEGIIPDFTRDSVNLGAEFILNVTNDSWFGRSSEPWIHLWITAFRSIELRVPLVRSTNTGFSAVIESTGKIQNRSDLFRDQNMYFTLPLQRPVKTFYAKHGEWFSKSMSWLCFMILTFLFLRIRYFLPRV